MKLNFLKSYFLTWVIIPFLLLLVWLGLSLLFTSKYSFSVVASPHDKSNFTSFKTSELLAKEKVAAQFQARENNLGIVSVRFYNFQRISKDVVIFRIKEKNQKKWFYENKYKVDQFQPDELFTFGFPIIPDSKNKIFQFEIESTKGRKGDAVAISAIYPPLVTQYQYPKQELLADKTKFVKFFAKKMFDSLSDKNFLISSLVYLLPFIFYILWGYFNRVKIKINLIPLLRIYIESRGVISPSIKNNYLLFRIYFLSVVILILFMDEANVYVSLILIALWIWLIKLHRFDSSISYILGLFFLLVSPIMILFGHDAIAQRSANWVYFYLVIGTVEAFAEMRWKLKNRVSYDMFLRQNFAWKSKGKNK